MDRDFTYTELENFILLLLLLLAAAAAVVALVVVHARRERASSGWQHSQLQTSSGGIGAADRSCAASRASEGWLQKPQRTRNEDTRAVAEALPVVDAMRTAAWSLLLPRGRVLCAFRHCGCPLHQTNKHHTGRANFLCGVYCAASCSMATVLCSCNVCIASLAGHDADPPHLHCRLAAVVAAGCSLVVVAAVVAVVVAGISLVVVAGISLVVVAVVVAVVLSVCSQQTQHPSEVDAALGAT